MKKKVTSLIVLAVCVLITVASVVNVFGDNQDVIDKAKKTVCRNEEKCDSTMTSMARTPSANPSPSMAGKTVDVSCRRSAIIFGEYSCEAGK